MRNCCSSFPVKSAIIRSLFSTSLNSACNLFSTNSRIGGASIVLRLLEEDGIVDFTVPVGVHALDDVGDRAVVVRVRLGEAGPLLE